MRGAWRNAFLLVAAAQELQEEQEDEQQQQQQDEEVLRRAHALCVAEAPLDSVVVRSCHRPALRRL
jgi:hypothetical protein